MAEWPTWNGEPMPQKDVIETACEAFDIVLGSLAGESNPTTSSKEEQLHLLEAGSLLELMARFATRIGLSFGRDAGASWAELGAAMGISRSSAKSRYERETRDPDDEYRRRMARLIESSGPLASIVDARPAVYAAAESEGWSNSEGPCEHESTYRETKFVREPEQVIVVTWNEYGEIAGSRGSGGGSNSVLNQAIIKAIENTATKHPELETASRSRHT